MERGWRDNGMISDDRDPTRECKKKWRIVSLNDDLATYEELCRPGQGLEYKNLQFCFSYDVLTAKIGVLFCKIAKN